MSESKQEASTPQATGPIPREHMEFIEKILLLAKEHNCATFSLEFRPGFGSEPSSFHHSIKASWSAGRHKEPSSVLVQSEQWDYLRI